MQCLGTTPEGFDQYMVHNNLIFLFDSLAVVPDLSQTLLRKFLRWAVNLSIYRYNYHYIKGEDNVCVDLMTRWSSPCPTIRRLVNIPELPSACKDDFQWPTRDTIASFLHRYGKDRPTKLNLIHGLWTYRDSKVWVPDDAAELELLLCIIAHTVSAGRRGRNATERALRSEFHWSTLSEDTCIFYRACIHRLSTLGGEKIPRSFGPALHGTKPGDLVQFDYIHLGISNSGDKYDLMIRDDHSDFKWFFCFPNTDTENAATAIIEWCSTFGVPNGLMSDGPTHFKNETARLVTRGLKTPHHFTLSYCPWSNGAVERLGRKLFCVLRAMISELQMDNKEWPDLIPIAQSVLNNSPSPQGGNVCPIIAFIGREPTSAMRTFLQTSTTTPVTVSAVQMESTANVQERIRLIAELHTHVHSTLLRQRKQAREAASRGEFPKFSHGDYVLVARSDFHAGGKLCLRWRGPRRITKPLNDYIFEVKDLRNRRLDEIYVSRLKLYRDSQMDAIAIMSHLLQSETGMVLSRLLGLEDGLDGLQVCVRWRELDSLEDSLEPIARFNEDVPQLFDELLKRKSTATYLVARARTEISL